MVPRNSADNGIVRGDLRPKRTLDAKGSYVIRVTTMPKRSSPPDDPKRAALRAVGALHPHPEAVRDPAFGRRVLRPRNHGTGEVRDAAPPARREPGDPRRSRLRCQSPGVLRCRGRLAPRGSPGSFPGRAAPGAPASAPTRSWISRCSGGPHRGAGGQAPSRPSNGASASRIINGRFDEPWLGGKKNGPAARETPPLRPARTATGSSRRVRSLASRGPRLGGAAFGHGRATCSSRGVCRRGLAALSALIPRSVGPAGAREREPAALGPLGPPCGRK